MSTKLERATNLRERLIVDVKHHVEVLNSFDENSGSGIVRMRIKAATSSHQQFEANWAQLEADPKYTHANSSDHHEVNRSITDAFLMAVGHAEQLVPTQASFSDAHSTLRDPPPHNPIATKLPTISIKKFDGDYNNWEQFRDTFLACFSERGRYEDVHKLLHLKGLLGDEPFLLIKNLKTTNENYSIAWDILTKRYSNKRKIAYSHFAIISDIPPMTSESISDIKSLLDVSNSSISALTSQCQEIGLLDQYLVFILSRKLDKESKRYWEEHLRASQELPEYATFKQFLEIRLNILENTQPTCDDKSKEKPYHKQPGSVPKQASPARVKTFHTTEKKQVVQAQCSICNQGHRPYDCPQLKTVAVTERWKKVIDKALCTNCLYNHSVAECKSKYRCVVCNKNHNSILHIDEATNVLSNEGNKSLVAHVYQNRQALLATARVLVKNRSGVLIPLRALIDQGSSINLMTESAAQLLGVNRSKCDVSLITVGGSNSLHAKHKTIISVNSINTAFNINVEAIIVSKITDLSSVGRSGVASWRHLHDLKLADPDFCAEGTIDLLLGVEVLADVLCDGVKFGPPGAPMAQNSHLGWILSGSVATDSVQKPTCCLVSIQATDTVDEINERIKRLWEIEEYDKKPILTQDEQKCENLFKSTTTIAPDGKYMVRLPFKIDPSDPNVLGDSYKMAVRRLLSSERRWERDPTLARQVTDYFDEYIKEGHLRPATLEEINDTTRCYFMPHQAVVKQSSTSTKVRVVFDASAKTSNGFSLNDRLLTGPTIQNDICSIIARWRTFPVAFTTDITKMYLQFWVHPDDARLQRILLRVNNQIQQFLSHTVTFGTASAPYQAIRLLFLLADECESEYPLVAALIRNNFYVDDCAGGAQNVEEAILKYNQMTKVFSTRGLKLRKWSSNSTELLKHIPLEHQETSASVELTNNTAKALGLYWARETDLIKFSLKLPDRGNFATKRSLLSDFSMLFDPLGWLAPSLIIPRIILQGVWLKGTAWDDFIPTEINDSWQKVRTQLQNLSDLSLPRWIGCSATDKHTSLHGFCDASERAYAAVIYLRCENECGQINCNIVAAKAKVAPLNRISLPRLELLGAKLLSDLYVKMKEIWPECKNIRAYTDSKIVLHWLANHPSKWSCFIGNRTAKIQNNIHPSLWFHVPTKLNPADCASRGLSPQNLVNESTWWHGPPFLKEPSDKWPKEQIVESPDDSITERRTQTNLVFTVVTDDDIPLRALLHRYSSLNKLLRATAILIRFANRRTWQEHEKATITVEELNRAKEMWIRIIQRHYFKTEFNALRESKVVSKVSKIISLTPFLQDGIIRLTGRLSNSLLPFNERHQIILPHEGYFTWLLINDAHQRSLHAGVSGTMQQLRLLYWIVHPRRTVQNQIGKCVTCYRFKAKVSEQIMGNLPHCRVQPSRPFYHTGVDFCGPFSIKTSALRRAPVVKGYVAIFTCMVTRAKHLEVVEDLSTEAFLAAMRRFVARRGLPGHIYSDNGTNFVGASNELPQLLQNAQHKQTQRIVNDLAADGIQWHFIPPHAPHFGGAWESGVKSIKYHMKRIIGEHRLLHIHLQTVIAQIEAALNSRPLCQINSEADEWQILTPAHFLIGRALNSIPEPDFTQIPQNRLRAYQLGQQLAQHFWKVWSGEYLHRLQQRHKWTSDLPNLQIGNIVLVKEDNLPAGKWSMARIVSTTTGTDGKVRVVELQLPESRVKRPITKVCPLPILDNHTNE